MTEITITCIRCGKRAAGTTYQRSGMCRPCKWAHNVQREQASIAINREVRLGRIPRAKDCLCTDCGAKAHDYDHRDYTKPLEVEPVCRSCNLKRGSAFDSVWRPETEAA